MQQQHTGHLLERRGPAQRLLATAARAALRSTRCPVIVIANGESESSEGESSEGEEGR